MPSPKGISWEFKIMKKMLFLILMTLVNILPLMAYDFMVPNASGNIIYYSIITDSISVLSRGAREHVYHYFPIGGISYTRKQDLYYH